MVALSFDKNHWGESILWKSCERMYSLKKALVWEKALFSDIWAHTTPHCNYESH